MIFILVSGHLFGQKNQLEGIVLNSDGETLPYVNIQILGSEKGIQSDHLGKFAMQFTDSLVILRISFVGYQTIVDTIQFRKEKKINRTYHLLSDVFGLEQVVVTGTRNEEKIRESVVGIGVTDSKTLQLVNANTVSEGLNFQPGLRTETNCQNCGYSQVRMNGLPGKYSQILINGRQSFSSLNSIYGLEQIPAILLDRIEIIKGGGSALYGANAMGGVINLITKDPINSGIELGINTGLIGFKTPETNANFLGSFVAKNNRFGLSFIGGHHFRKAFDANGDGFSELPKLNSFSGELKSYFKPKEKHRLDFAVKGSYEYRRGGDQLHLEPELTNIAEELKSKVLGGDMAYQFYTSNQQHKFDFYVSGQYTHMDNYYGSGFDPDGYGLTTDFTGIGGMNYTYLLNKIGKEGSGKLVFGSEYRMNIIDDNKPGYNVQVHQEIQNLGVFGQFDLKILNWLKVNVGVRSDIDNIIQKLILNPRVGILFDTKVNIQIRANYSRGYMAPQIFSDEIHAQLVSGDFRRVVLGGNLKYETSNTVNLGVKYFKSMNQHEFVLGLEGFYTQINNPFVLENKEIDSQLVLLKVNGDESFVAGLNLEMKYAFKRFFMADLAFTAQMSQFKTPIEWTTGQYLTSFLKTPNYYGSLILSSMPFKRFTISSSLNVTGSMWVPHYAGFISTDRLERTPWFFDWGIKFSYDLDIGKYCLIFDLGMRNILNSYQNDFDEGALRDGSYIYGPQRPRTLYFGVKFSTF
ncbi:MAG: TonB-dependent receptor [Crocinitomicaceae bacterium]